MKKKSGLEIRFAKISVATPSINIVTYIDPNLSDSVPQPPWLALVVHLTL